MDVSLLDMWGAFIFTASVLMRCYMIKAQATTEQSHLKIKESDYSHRIF